MSPKLQLPGLSFEDKGSWYLVCFALLAVFGLWRWFDASRPDPSLPVVQIERQGILAKFLPAKIFWFKDGPGLISKGITDFNNTPFQVPANGGWKIIMPQRYADELRNHPDLSFTDAVRRDFFVGYPGFDAFTEGLKDDVFMQEVVRVKLTQSLGLVTDDLVEETNDSLHDILGEGRDFQAVPIKTQMLDIIARLSSRVLLGKTLCRNKDWLEIAKNYTVDLFKSAHLMRVTPTPARPLLYLINTPCKRIYAQVKSARRLVTEEMDSRRDRTQEILDRGEKPPKQADAIAWMVETAQSHNRVPDYVAAQLSLSMAAIHTTSETALNSILQLCESPELVTELRQEVIKVLTTEGWSKQALYKLRIMDSFLRETQRVRAMACTTMNRFATKDIALSDGIVLRAGSRIIVHDSKLDNAESFPEPHKFDAHRFLNMRSKPGEENRHQFVTPTADHMSFGYGVHACPGRFFAANEIKILLCFFLLKYDFRYVRSGGEDGLEEQKPRYFTFESARMADPKCRIELRRREEELDLMDPTAGKEKAVV